MCRRARVGLSVDRPFRFRTSYNDRMCHKLACVATLSSCITCACAGDSFSVGFGRESAAGRPDPCSLVMTSEAGAILAAAVTPSRPELNSATSCRYVAPSAESVTLQVHYGSASEFDASVKTAEESFGSRSVPVTDIGEKAVFNVEQLIVREGNDFFMLTIGTRINDKKRLKIGTELARKVVVRLGS
jgi:hypothetical protein